MAELARFTRPLLSFVLLGATALGLFNVYGDPTAVDALASTTACGGQSACVTRVLKLSRNPIQHTYDLSVRPEGTAPFETQVTCQRQWYLLGDYACVGASLTGRR